jgi:N-acetyl-D-muramate 6-phosphate phosphatase
MSIDIKRIQAICFDVDGTLSDTDDQWVEQLARLLRPAARIFPGRDERAAARWLIMGAETPGNMAYTLLDWAHLDAGLAKLYNFIQKRRIYLKSNSFWIIPQVKETLICLHERYPLSIVSARDHDGTCEFLEQFEIRHFFHSIATAQTCEHTKPFADPILWVAQQMRVPPENCLMVGDTFVDIYAGKAAGAQTVGVLCGFGTEQDLRRAGADLILATTNDLLDFLGMRLLP